MSLSKHEQNLGLQHVQAEGDQDLFGPDLKAQLIVGCRAIAWWGPAGGLLV